MPDRYRHSWKVTPAEAVAIQQRLRPYVFQEDALGRVDLVAGVDVGFEASGTITRAAVAVLRLPDLHLVDSALARRPTTFPYIPGLLSFREVPAILRAMSSLTSMPDLLICDGQGLAHPRRFGLACHLGLLCDIPTVGVGKTRLVGTHDPVGPHKGSRQPLTHKGELIGSVLRTRDRVKPVYVSVGHRISLETAVSYVLSCTTRYRLPETTRSAHKLASGSPS